MMRKICKSKESWYASGLDRYRYANDDTDNRIITIVTSISISTVTSAAISTVTSISTSIVTSPLLRGQSAFPQHGSAEIQTQLT